jgi:uncharacterized iron-regulated membrane protein
MNVRQLWLSIHRYAGLTMAAFLIVAGVTGSVIAFSRELDAWLNRDLFTIVSHGEPLPSTELIARVERSDPRMRVIAVPLQIEPGKSAAFGVQPKVDPTTHRPFDLGHDELFADPITGKVLGMRKSDACCLGRRNIIPFLVRLHYTLYLLDPWGTWMMGLTALIWVFDCFVGAYLTLPASRIPRKASRLRSWWQRWKPAWMVRVSVSAYRINFDLHRAAGLWTWAMLLVLAVSSLQYNLYDEIFAPILKALLPVEEVYESLPKLPKPLHDPSLSWEQALNHGRVLMAERAKREGFTVEREDNLWLDPSRGVFVYVVKSSFDIRDRQADARVYLSAIDGRELGFDHPYLATGNAVSQWLSALHTGRVGGLPYRIFLSLMGLIVAILSITGIVIWWKKRKARVRAVQMSGKHVS